MHEICTCETQTDAFIRERYYFDELQPELNSIRPKTTGDEDKLTRYVNTKQYRLDNKEKLIEYRKRYTVENKEKILQQQKKYKLENKEKRKQYQLDNAEKMNKHYSEKLYCQTCDSYHRRGDKSTHRKTKKHLDNSAKNAD